MENYTCEQCKKDFRNYPSNHRKFCSRRCQGISIRTERPNCKVCGKKCGTMRNIYCSRGCKNKELGFQNRNITSYSGLYWKLQRMYPNPKPCIKCGKKGKHRHHPDYDKPLEIVWSFQ